MRSHLAKIIYKFRSEKLDLMIPPKCTYSNEVMVEGAKKRFLEGRSGSEMFSSLDISEGHARKLSNQALEIFSRIHEESVPKLKEQMESYILQIDGTADSEFSMIVAVRDSVSGFVLYVKRCDSESEESIKDVLNTVKSGFGIPSGITCDMRSGIISAAQMVFPHTPIRICLMHFLRDLGKDLMEDIHTDPGLMINSAGIKSSLRKILREIPDYNRKTLEEIESGFCTDRSRIETMAIRRILENILSLKSSGYGFPFSLRHLNFFTACEEGRKKLSDLAPAVTEKESGELISPIGKYVSKITDITRIKETANKLRDINSIIFRKIREAFRIPGQGNLSVDTYNPLTDDSIVQSSCTIVFGGIDVYMRTRLEKHMFTAAKLAVERYRKRESMLFAQNPECTIPGTNNNMEIFFRKIRRNIRKRSGNRSTGNILAQSGEKLALFQNIGNTEYRDIVFGSGDMGAVFAKYRKPFKKDGRTRKRTIEVVDEGTEMILSNSLRTDPYTEEMFNKSSGLYINRRNNGQ